MSLLYGAQFLVIGLAMPLLPVWLDARGLGAQAIGTVLAAQGLARTVSQLLLARLADVTGMLRAVMLVCIVLAVCVTVWLGGWAHSFWPLLIGVALAWFFFSPLVPLTEVLGVRVMERAGVAYGRLRLWGSLTFTIGALIAGVLMDILPATALIWAVVAAQVLTAATVLMQPPSDTPESDAGKRDIAANSAIWRELLSPGFMLFLVVAGLVQASHALLYGFSALHWQSLGHAGVTIGLLVTAGVLAEILLFWFSADLPRRFGAVGLLMLGAAASLLRWLGMAFDPPLAALFALQLLHAFTFGAAHLGAIAFIRSRAPRRLAATAQALYSSVSMGLFMMAAMWASGRLYEAHASRAWLAMASMAALALPLAWLLRRMMPPRT